jgi:hypothetical protein
MSFSPYFPTGFSGVFHGILYLSPLFSHRVFGGGYSEDDRSQGQARIRGVLGFILLDVILCL